MLRRFVAASSAALVVCLFYSLAFAQGHMGHMPPPDMQNSLPLNVTEIVTGLAASVMAFQAALAYREGRLGRGMSWAAIGMVIMAVGHVILVLRRIVGFDVLGFLGRSGSFVGFSLAVFASFLASSYGFWLIRRDADRSADARPDVIHVRTLHGAAPPQTPRVSETRPLERSRAAAETVSEPEDRSA
jgi:hypothetical protein